MLRVDCVTFEKDGIEWNVFSNILSLKILFGENHFKVF